MTSVTEKHAAGSRAPRHSTHCLFAAMMRSTGVATALVAGVVAVAAALFGPPGALGSVAAGVLVSAMFFALGTFGLRVVLMGPDAGALVGALAIYVVQVMGLLALLLVAPPGLVPSPRWFAAGALVEVVAWQVAQVYALTGSRVFALPAIERRLDRVKGKGR